ncbi:Tn3 family transposase [Streptomyces sp. NPDC101150]|uniref:Tn3 family transposase n=1 Tax=Streptomyces sp. NPDC101150 TaxID=3366114 RepID=UPI00381448AC
MVEGAMRHGTTVDVEVNYTDGHGQSEFGFGVTWLLNFDLLRGIKRIIKVKLYRPVAGDPDAYPQLGPALARPIRWELFARQYDQMVKYATAIRRRTASTEAVLRRFTRNASHPTYAAMLGVGHAQKTILVVRYLRLRDLEREIEEGPNVMESSNGVNSVIAYGKRGEIASNRRDEQEMFVLCLRILQSALVYENTLMLQDVLGEPERADLLIPADRRGLTPLFWSHVRRYGDVNLDVDTRLNLAAATVAGPGAWTARPPDPPWRTHEPAPLQAVGRAAPASRLARYRYVAAPVRPAGPLQRPQPRRSCHSSGATCMIGSCAGTAEPLRAAAFIRCRMPVSAG